MPTHKAVSRLTSWRACWRRAWISCHAPSSSHDSSSCPFSWPSWPWASPSPPASPPPRSLNIPKLLRRSRRRWPPQRSAKFCLWRGPSQVSINPIRGWAGWVDPGPGLGDSECPRLLITMNRWSTLAAAGVTHPAHAPTRFIGLPRPGALPGGETSCGSCGGSGPCPCPAPCDGSGPESLSWKSASDGNTHSKLGPRPETKGDRPKPRKPSKTHGLSEPNRFLCQHRTQGPARCFTLTPKGGCDCLCRCLRNTTLVMWNHYQAPFMHPPLILRIRKKWEGGLGTKGG